MFTTIKQATCKNKTETTNKTRKMRKTELTITFSIDIISQEHCKIKHDTENAYFEHNIII